MKILRPYLIILLILTGFAAYFWGCLDATNFPVEQLNGVVFGDYGFPVFQCLVRVENFSGDFSYFDGKFEIENVQKPYNIVCDKEGKSISKYIDLRSDNPYLFVPYYNNNLHDKSILVKFPALGGDEVLYLKYISNDVSFSFTSKLHGGTYITESYVYFTPSQNSDYGSGRIIYLLTKQLNNNIISYEAFGIKDISWIGNHITLTFTNEDVNFNPEEKLISINAQPPAGTTATRTDVYLDFLGYDKNNDLLLYSTNSSNLQIVVPLLPALDSKVKAVNEFHTSGYGEKGYNYQISNPGDNINISHQAPFKTLFPLNGQENVTDTNTICAEENGYDGVYLFSMSSNFGSEETWEAVIVTKNNYVKFSDFLSAGLPYIKNNLYHWSVTKYQGYSSMDDFVSTAYLLDNRSDNSQTPGEFYFTTAR